MMNGTNKTHNGDEQQEDTNSYNTSDDVDAGHYAKALSPCCHSYQQQAHQLR